MTLLCQGASMSTVYETAPEYYTRGDTIKDSSSYCPVGWESFLRQVLPDGYVLVVFCDACPYSGYMNEASWRYCAVPRGTRICSDMFRPFWADAHMEHFFIVPKNCYSRITLPRGSWEFSGGQWQKRRRLGYQN
jgi:hypothetical protein